MRIIAGTLGGRRLRAPPGHDTRPTSDRVREALFNILAPPPPDAAVLDLFAGSGALGFEALSRGASRCVAVDASRAVTRILRENAAALGVGDATEVHCGDALRLLPRLCGPFQWVFVDPPYASELAERALAALGRGELLGPGAVVVVEHDRRRAPPETVDRMVRTDRRRYGDTELSFYAAAPETP